MISFANKLFDKNTFKNHVFLSCIPINITQAAVGLL